MASTRESGSYRRPRRPSGGGGGLLIVGVLLAVLGGLVYVFKGTLIEKLGLGDKPVARKKKEDPKAKVPDKPTARKKRTKKREKVVKADVPPSKPKRKVLAGHDQKADDLIKQAEAAYKGLKFKDATALFSQVESLNCSEERRKKALGLQNRSNAFHTLTSAVTMAPEATAKLSKLRMASGRTMTGVVREKTESGYKVAFPGRATMTLPAEEVLEVTEVTEEEARAERVNRFNQRAALVKENSSIGHCQTGLIAYQFNLPDKALKELEAAYANDKELATTMYNYKAWRLLQTAIWRDSMGSSWAKLKCNEIIKKYPESKVVADARELLDRIKARGKKKNYKATFKIKTKKKAGRKPKPSESEAPPKETKQETDTITSAAASRDVAEGNRLFNEGLNHYRQGMAGQGSTKNSHLSKAARLFEQSMTHYERAKAADPNNSSLDSRITDANMLRYGSMKSQTLGF